MTGYEISSSTQRALARLEKRLAIDGAAARKAAFAGVLSDYDSQQGCGGAVSELVGPDGKLPSVRWFAAQAHAAVVADRRALAAKGLVE